MVHRGPDGTGTARLVLMQKRIYKPYGPGCSMTHYLLHAITRSKGRFKYYQEKCIPPDQRKRKIQVGVYVCMCAYVCARMRVCGRVGWTYYAVQQRCNHKLLKELPARAWRRTLAVVSPTQGAVVQLASTGGSMHLEHLC